jgi:hypothetical protein
MWGWVLLVVSVGIAIALVALASLVPQLHRDLSRTEAENDAATAVFNQIDLADFRFARDRLRPSDRFYLVVGDAARRDPFTTRSGRNFALWYLYPAVAVERVADADVVIGVDGSEIDSLARGHEVERHGSVSVARVGSR